MSNQGTSGDGEGGMASRGVSVRRGLGHNSENVGSPERSRQGTHDNVALNQEGMFGHDESMHQEMSERPNRAVTEQVVHLSSGSSIHGPRHPIQGNPVGPQPNQGMEETMKKFFDMMAQATQQPPRAPAPARESEAMKMFLSLVKTMKNIGTQRFKGGASLYEADKWMQTMEKNLEATMCPEEYKKRVAVYYLEDDALGWWTSVERQHKDEIISWTMFKSEFEKKYFPPEAKHRLEREFMNLTQGSKTVREYESEFTRLRRHVFNGEEDEDTMVRNFKYGLRQEIGIVAAMGNFTNLTDLVEKAVNVEARLGFKSSDTRGGGNSRNNQGAKGGQQDNKGKGKDYGRKGNDYKEKGNNSRKSGACYNCGQHGHISRNCPGKKDNYRVDLLGHVTCFNCGEKGHYANKCPNPRPRAVAPLAVHPPPARPAIEQAPKRRNIGGRMYALELDDQDLPNPPQGPITGI